MKKRNQIILILITCCNVISLFICIGLYRSTVKTAAPDFDVGYNNNEAEWISLVNLIATPEKYDGKAVMIEGVFRCEMESDCLYLTMDDYTNRISSNAVNLDLVDMDVSVDRWKLKNLSGHYVLIEGVFNYNDEGYITLYSGTIEKINRIETIGW